MRKFTVNEDWLAVVLALVLMALATWGGLAIRF